MTDSTATPAQPVQADVVAAAFRLLLRDRGLWVVALPVAVVAGSLGGMQAIATIDGDPVRAGVGWTLTTLAAAALVVAVAGRPADGAVSPRLGLALFLRRAPALLVLAAVLVGLPAAARAAWRDVPFVGLVVPVVGVLTFTVDGVVAVEGVGPVAAVRIAVRQARRWARWVRIIGYGLVTTVLVVPVALAALAVVPGRHAHRALVLGPAFAIATIVVATLKGSAYRGFVEEEASLSGLAAPPPTAAPPADPA